MEKITELFSHRQLIHELISRDIRTRYTGSLLGLFWSVLNPLFQLVLYTLVFSVFLGVKFGNGDHPGRFAENLFCALLPWSAFQESITRSARAFLDNGNLIKKLRFPLATLPFSITSSALIHQLIATVVFFIVLIARGNIHYGTLPLLVPLLLVQAMLMYGFGMIVATVNVFFKDIAQIIGVVFMFLFWLTPIVYPKTIVPATYLPLLDLNPLTHMVEAFRFAVFGEPSLQWWGLAYWAALSGLSVWFGGRLLRRSRRDLLDLV